MIKLRIVIIWLLIFGAMPGCSKNSESERSDSLSLSRESFRNSRYTDTLWHLRRINDEEAKTEEYYLMQGVSFFKTGDLNKSIVSFEKVKPGSVELQTYIAYLYLLVGDSDKAMELSEYIESQYGPISALYVLKGNICLKRNAFAEAEKFFTIALKLQKDSTKAMIGLANLFFSQRNFAKAEEYYLRALFVADNDISVYIALSNYYVAMNRYDDAENNLLMGLQIAPDNANLLILLSNIYTKAKKYSKVVHVLKKALMKHPDSVSLNIRIAKLYLHLDQFDEAYKIIQYLRDRKVDDYYVSMLLGEYYIRKNEFRLALSTFNKLQKTNTGSYKLNYYLGLIYLFENKLMLSKQFLHKSITAYPGFGKTHLLLAFVYLHLKQYNLASEHASLVLQLEPGNMSGHVINGISLYLQGFLNEADYEFELVGGSNSDNPIIFFFNTIKAVADENYDQAERELSEIDFNYIERLFLELEVMKLTGLAGGDAEKRLRQYEEDSPSYLSFILMGNFYMDKGDVARAYEYFENSIALNDRCIIPYYYQAEIESGKGDLEPAISLLNKVIELNPRLRKAYVALGGLYERTNDFNAARSTYQQGLEHWPNDSTLLNNLAWVYLVNFKDKASASAYIRRAITISPDNVSVKDTFGWYYYCSNQFERAVGILKDVVLENPYNSLYQFHLGMSLFKNGDKELAAVHLEIARELKDENDTGLKSWNAEYTNSP